MKLSRKMYGVTRRGLLCDRDGIPTPSRFAIEDFVSQGLGMTLAEAIKAARPNWATDARGRIVRVTVTIETSALPKPSPRKRP